MHLLVHQGMGIDKQPLSCLNRPDGYVQAIGPRRR